MLSTRNKLLVVWIFLLTTLRSHESESARALPFSAKMNALKCYSNKPEQMSFNECGIFTNGSLRAQTLTEIKVVLTKLWVTLRLLRKQAAGYVPFIININFDWCEFMEKRNNEVFQRIFYVIERYSNIAKKCPINIGFTYSNLTLGKGKTFGLPFRFPSSDYRLDMIIDANDVIRLTIKMYFKMNY